ncbi:MAG: DUF1499 domain-containing protein [Pseudomonadota bacterium]
MRFVLLALPLLAMAGLAYIRLAPSDPEDWHVDPADGQTGPGKAHARLDLAGETPEQALTRLDAIAMATPRTIRLAGSVEEGRVTYITRSAAFGFPDYTTVGAQPKKGGTVIDAFGRLRFGKYDLDVNAKRINGWLRALQADV